MPWETWFFTYGVDHKDEAGNSLGHSYSTISAPNPEVARGIMFAIRGKAFAFMYTPDRGRELVEKYNLVRYELPAKVN